MSDSDEDVPQAQRIDNAVDQSTVEATPLTLNLEGDINFGDAQNDTFACIADKNKLFVNFGDGRRLFTRSYAQPASGLFLDPTGNHLLVSFPTGDLEYCNLLRGDHRSVLLSGASHGLPSASFVVTAVGWDQTNTSDTSTGLILIGSREGAVFEMRLDAAEKTPIVRPLFSDAATCFKEPITGISVERFTSLRKCVVMIASQRRLARFYSDFTSNSSTLRTVLESRHNRDIEKTLSPSDNNNGRIAVYRPAHGVAPVSWLWNSCAGIYHGVFTPTADGADDPVTTLHIPLGGTAGRQGVRVPIDISLTAYHQVWTYEDRILVVHAPAGLPWIPSRLVARIGASQPGRPLRVASAAAPSASKDAPASLTEADLSERVRRSLGIRGSGRLGVRDTKCRKNFIVTGLVFFELEVKNEHRASWRLFLERGLDTNEEQSMRARYLGAAAKICRVFDPKKLSLVNWCRGKFHAEAKQFREAAIHFAACERFDDVISFLTANSTQNTVIDYLEQRINYLQTTALRAVRDPELACLIVFATERHLERLAANAAADTHLLGECTKQFNVFLQKCVLPYVKTLSSDAYYAVLERMLAAHGQTDALVMLAENMNRFRFTIGHHVNNKAYRLACKVLTEKCLSPEYAHLWYEYAPFFLQHCQADFFDGLSLSIKVERGQTQGRSILQPELLIPSFVAFKGPGADEGTVENMIFYFDRLVLKNCPMTQVSWNFYLSLAIEHDHVTLQNILKNPRALYSEGYALRKLLECDDNEVKHHTITLYRSMNMIAEAVKVAIDLGDLELAKTLARDGDMDPLTRKGLWKQIADQVAASDDCTPATILAFTKESGGVLVFEDVLPILTRNNIILAEIRDAVYNSLTEYSAKIKELKLQMDTATKTAANIKTDEIRLANQFSVLGVAQKCEHCNKGLVQTVNASAFLVYPTCSHAVHTLCAEQLYARASQQRREKIAEELGMSAAESRDVRLMAEADCPICGELAIEQVEDPFFDERDTERQLWEVEFGL